MGVCGYVCVCVRMCGSRGKCVGGSAGICGRMWEHSGICICVGVRGSISGRVGICQSLYGYVGMRGRMSGNVGMCGRVWVFVGMCGDMYSLHTPPKLHPDRGKCEGSNLRWRSVNKQVYNETEIEYQQNPFFPLLVVCLASFIILPQYYIGSDNNDNSNM